MNIGDITVAFEVTEEDGRHHNVWFDVPATDEEFRAAVIARWQASEKLWDGVAGSIELF